ncbi:MAG: hypothetical protein DIU74_005625 [Pseudomonadota bacterium]|nr:MAG: hypothetical protein DIU74_01980 [Pseudomonadota bacterium]
MKKTLPVLTAAAFGLLVAMPLVAADGNTRAPSDTPQDRASDRHRPLEDTIDQRRRNEPPGGTAGAYEGRTGGQPRNGDGRPGESGSGGAQSDDLGASQGGRDNAFGGGSTSQDTRDAPARRTPEHP